MYKIGTLNKISPVGLARLTDNYTVVDDDRYSCIFQVCQHHGRLRSAVWCTFIGSRYNVLVLPVVLGALPRSPLQQGMGGDQRIE